MVQGKGSSSALRAGQTLFAEGFVGFQAGFAAGALGCCFRWGLRQTHAVVFLLYDRVRDT